MLKRITATKFCRVLATPQIRFLSIKSDWSDDELIVDEPPIQLSINNNNDEVVIDGDLKPTTQSLMSLSFHEINLMPSRVFVNNLEEYV